MRGSPEAISGMRPAGNRAIPIADDSRRLDQVRLCLSHHLVDIAVDASRLGEAGRHCPDDVAMAVGEERPRRKSAVGSFSASSARVTRKPEFESGSEKACTSPRSRSTRRPSGRRRRSGMIGRAACHARLASRRGRDQLCIERRGSRISMRTEFARTRAVR